MTWFLLGLVSGLALAWVGCAVEVAVPQRKQLGRLIGAAGQAVLAVGDFQVHQPLGALNAAACAWCLWKWWRDGGGDGTKRRLRKLRARFVGVRRTAPAAAMAVTQ